MAQAPAATDPLQRRVGRRRKDDLRGYGDSRGRAALTGRPGRVVVGRKLVVRRRGWPGSVVAQYAEPLG